MKLVDIDISRYRSVREQSGEESIEFDGLDCLVGKNNAGKTNVLCAIQFVLGQSEKNHDDELFWDKDPDHTVEVRAFFDVTEDDLQRIESDTKRENIRNSLLDERGHDGVLGICRRASMEPTLRTEAKLLQFLPDDEHYSRDNFVSKRNELWEEYREGDLTKTEFRDNMEEVFPEVAELIPKDKKKNKGDWKSKYDEYVASRPEGLDFSLQPADFEDGTKSLIFDELLPRLISIPAIKEIESATQRGGEFGDLIDQLSTEVEDELDAELGKRLDGFKPGTHDGIQRVERQVSDHLGSTFDDQTIEFDFPEISSDYLFRNADITIQEENLDDLSKENVGEGVKRTLIFSLIRTIADVREGQLAINGDEEQKSDPRPLLILYEEAELFLHPSLQKTLLRTFEQLTETNAQVVFSTHSPILIQRDILDTINIVTDEGERGTCVTQFHSVLEDQSEANKSRLTDLQSVSSYIFADRVVLVEGLTDRVVFRKLAQRLDPEWDFNTSSTTLLAAGGKGNVCRFYRFLNELGIETFAVLDVDAAKSECETIVSDESTLAAIDEFAEQVESEFAEPQYDTSELENGIRLIPWDDAFEKIEDLQKRIEEEEQTTEEDAELLERVLAKCESSTPPNEVWASPEVEEKRVQAVEHLLEHNILLLSGELEDYYPHTDENKREAALRFNADEHEIAELRDRFQHLPTHERDDIDAFLEMVFSPEAESSL